MDEKSGITSKNAHFTPKTNCFFLPSYINQYRYLIMHEDGTPMKKVLILYVQNCPL